MDIDGFTVEALTSGRFDDLGAVLGKGGIGGCWCMYWTTSTTAEWRENCRGGSTAPNKSGMLDLVATGPPPGLLAYDDGEPADGLVVRPRVRAASSACAAPSAAPL